MAEGDAGRAEQDSWVDDLATIVAGWRDARPVLSRLLLLAAAALAAMGTPWSPGSNVLAAALLALLLPRLRFGAGRVARTIGAVLAVAGAVAEQSDVADLSRTEERVLTSLLLTVGVLVGARRGPWWTWPLVGLLLVPRQVAGGPVFVDWSALGGALALIVVARTSFTPTGRECVRGAREGLAVRVQKRPWHAASALVALAIVTPSAGMGVQLALVCVAFHATWRASTLFERTAPWAAAALLPGAAGAVHHLTLVVSGGYFRNWTLADAALSPVWLLPLVVGLVFGRRAPAATPRRGDAAWVLGACGASLCVSAVLDFWRVEWVDADFSDATGFLQVLPYGLTVALVLLLVAFHLATTSALAPRTILLGALILAVTRTALMATALSTSDTAHMSFNRGAPHVLDWVGVGLVCLFARDVARVTHIPADHPIVTDWTPRDARA